jgi:hypothetical protein
MADRRAWMVSLSIVVTCAIACGGSESPSGTGSSNGSPLDGTWKGYVESYKFPSGSDTVTLSLATKSDGSITGAAVFGDGPAPPPPTDPNVGYPPSLEAGSTCSFPGGPRNFSGEGFVFTVLGATFSSGRLTLKVETRELWKQWCAMQTSYPGGSGASDSYFCLPNWGFTSGASGCGQTDPTTMAFVPRDCGKICLCTAGPGPCACNATACSVDVTSTNADLSFDVVVSNGSADGSTSGTFGDHNVHLKRQ